MEFVDVDARVVVLRTLSLRFGTPGSPAPAARGLAAFQQEAVGRLRDIIGRYRGALLADSVGLGKTHVATALIDEYLRDGRPVLVCAPAQLRTHWKRHLGRRRGWDWASHTVLSRSSAASAATAACAGGLFVIDEAHAFRNPATRRYRCAAGMARDADLLLVTATPVNNSILDFHWLVRLFAADDAFGPIGVPDLAAAAAAALHGGEPSALRRVAEAVVVRRTRNVLQVAAGDGRRTGPVLRFPRREAVITLGYDLRGVLPDLDVLLRLLARLQFPVHAAAAAAVPPAELMRLNLLKRLESGLPAFAASLERHAQLLDHARSATADGLLLLPRDRRRLYGDVDGAVQLAMGRIVLEPWPADRDRAAHMEAIVHEQQTLARLRGALGHHHGDATPPDPKLVLLRELLTGPLASEAVVVFTEWRDTAAALWRALLPGHRIGLVDGREARLGRSRATRRSVIDRFAPVANRARMPAEHERVRVLVATDVIAEGMNLQDARVVVSYDMPWNPVRLAQRIGRIDRLGSPHDSVLAYAFVPDRSIEGMLRLMRRVRSKLRAIRTIGGDAPLLRTPGNGGVRAHAQAGAGVRADAVTPLAEAVELAERLRIEWRRNHGDREAQQRPAGAALLAGWTWRQDGAAVLCVVDAGGPPWLVLVPDRGRARLGGAAADALLLQVLQQAGPTPLLDDAAAAAIVGLRREPGEKALLERAARAAIALVWRTLAPPARPAGKVRRSAVARAAALVRRRLAAAGTETDMTRQADAVLQLLARPLPPDTAAGVAAALRLPDDPSRFVALLTLAEAAAPLGGAAPAAGAAAARRNPASGHASSRRPRLVAAIRVAPLATCTPAGQLAGQPPALAPDPRPIMG